MRRLQWLKVRLSSSSYLQTVAWKSIFVAVNHAQAIYDVLTAGQRKQTPNVSSMDSIKAGFVIGVRKILLDSLNYLFPSLIFFFTISIYFTMSEQSVYYDNLRQLKLNTFSVFVS